MCGQVSKRDSAQVLFEPLQVCGLGPAPRTQPEQFFGVPIDQVAQRALGLRDARCVQLVDLRFNLVSPQLGVSSGGESGATNMAALPYQGAPALLSLGQCRHSYLPCITW